MKGIAVDLTGAYSTKINFTQKVEGKTLQIQKYMINVATTAGSDFIFPNRGTELLSSAIGGALVAVNNLSDGYAGVDTLYFCNYEESKSVYDSDDNIVNFTLSPSAYNLDQRSVTFTASITFADGKEIKTELGVANNG